MMRGLAFQAFTEARCMFFVVLLVALRCAVGWRSGCTLRSLPSSASARAHDPSRDHGATPPRRRCSFLPLRSAVGYSSRTTAVSRRRRGRLRDGGSGAPPRIHDWSLSLLSTSPPNSPTLESNCEVETCCVGARNGGGESARRRRRAGGDVLVLARAEGGEGGYQQQHPPRRNRRQRRRQRLRLRAAVVGEVVGAGVAEEEEAVISGIESNIVEAGSLDIGAAVRTSVAVGATTARGSGVSSEDSGAEAAGGELGPTSDWGGLSEEAVRSSPPMPREARGAERQGCAVSARERSLSSAGADDLRAEEEEDDDRFMRMALRLAERARMEGEVPIGAVLTETVASGGSGGGKRRVLSTGRNRVERRRDASAHAEMLCLQAAAKARRNWRLAGATLYVTMEPCAMCLSAAQLFRVDRVVFGAPNPNLGACGGRVDLSAQKHAFHDLAVTGGVLAEECATPLRGFFRSRRREGEAAASASASAAAGPRSGDVAVGGRPPQATAR